MLRNINVPLFQDKSGVGKAVGMVIRVVWVWLGGAFTVIFLVPALVLLLIYILLPALATGEIILGFSQVIL